MNASCKNTKIHENSTNLEFLHDNMIQWRETPSEKIEYAPKEETIFLSGGLTLLQDKLIESALNSIGINYISLPNPDFASFQTGKSYGNRGQCNPTYFTVGNLVKYLQKLRDEQGVSSKEIVKKYVYITAGGCGPCRFGMYITEYKKALRDAGFEGLRITAFEHNKGLYQGDGIDDTLIDFSPKFFVTLLKATIIGDLINILGYKMRPYEIIKGSVDHAMEESRALISEAFMEHKSLFKALRQCRTYFKKVKLDRLQPKAKVMVMGEFWASMTEGDGNYNLHRFLEAEGAECIPQPIINRLMLSLWEAEQEQRRKDSLADEEAKRIDFEPMKTKYLLKAGKIAIRFYINLYAKAIGLHDYHVPNIDKLANYSKTFYTLECEAGEGHLEVAHLVESVKENLAHLVISVKPFGCMPSSSVSDGIQSLVTSRFPETNFLAIETSGEGAANFHSRVQMALFKAKQAAKEEFEALSIPEQIPSKVHHYIYQPKNRKVGSAARLIESL
jgi:predicted nucleotide-binding protein (sugar kinase/HSP70/actin superfamily)